jgi:uncharacterized protein YgiB involved in biofilm formation
MTRKRRATARIAAAIMAGMLVFSVAACGDDDDDVDGVETELEQEAEEAEDELEAEEQELEQEADEAEQELEEEIP